MCMPFGWLNMVPYILRFNSSSVSWEQYRRFRRRHHRYRYPINPQPSLARRLSAWADAVVVYRLLLQSSIEWRAPKEMPNLSRHRCYSHRCFHSAHCLSSQHCHWTANPPSSVPTNANAQRTRRACRCRAPTANDCRISVPFLSGKVAVDRATPGRGMGRRLSRLSAR